MFLSGFSRNLIFLMDKAILFGVIIVLFLLTLQHNLNWIISDQQNEDFDSKQAPLDHKVSEI